MKQTVTTDKDKPYELDIKEFIIQNPQLFNVPEPSTVVFEKSISEFNVIADALIFSHQYGIIGIEIKTEHDTTKRLRKQLSAYKHIANEVYVLIHISHAKKVKEILDMDRNYTVGIISYAVIDGKISGIVEREAKVPREFKPKYILNVLWKEELLAIYKTMSNPELFKIASEDHYLSMYNTYATKVRHMRKSQLIVTLLREFSALDVFDIVVDMFVYQNMSPDKPLKYYKFTREGEE